MVCGKIVTTLQGFQSMTTIHRALIVVTTTAGLLSGCAAVTYDVAQDSAKRACDKHAYLNERDACRKQHEMTYEHYEQQRQGIAQHGTEKPVAKKDDGSLCFKRATTGQTVCPN
jgi:hypothetical protein